jgi:hypothetical protein
MIRLSTLWHITAPAARLAPLASTEERLTFKLGGSSQRLLYSALHLHRLGLRGLVPRMPQVPRRRLRPLSLILPLDLALLA